MKYLGTGPYSMAKQCHGERRRYFANFCTLDGNGTKKCLYFNRRYSNTRHLHCNLAHDGAAPIINPNDNPNAVHRIFLRAYNVTDSAGVALSTRFYLYPLTFIPATDELASSGKDTVSSAAVKNVTVKQMAISPIFQPTITTKALKLCDLS